MINEEDFLGMDDYEELEEYFYNKGYELEEIQDVFNKFGKEIQKIYAERNYAEVVKYLKFQMDYKRENYVYFGEPRLPKSSNPDDEFYEAKQYLNAKGYILVEAKAKDDSLYAWARDRMKKNFQKYVPEFKEVNGKVDAKSFQDWLIKKLKRKINFHTSPKGELFWELTEKEAKKNDVYYALIAYNIRTDYFGRNYDKIKIIINSEYNKKIFDTSCWSDNIRAYRAEVSAEADPMMVELANKIMRAYNKVPKYVQAGKIFKSRIMQVEPDGEWHSIGSTLDIDAIEEMGYNLKNEMYNDVTVEKNKGVFPSVNISFEYNYSLVEIQAMVAPMCCKCEMKVTKK